MTKTAVLCLVPCLMAAGTIAAEEAALPPALKAREGLYEVHLKTILATKQITDEKERAFLEKLSENVGQPEILSLLAFMRYVAPVRQQPFGTMTSPDGKTTQTYTDTGLSYVSMSRMRLKECYATRIDNRERRIYVFAAFTGWPGKNDTCVILTDEKDYVIDWRGNSHSDMFAECTFADQVLTIICDRRSGGRAKYFFDIDYVSISRRNKVEIVPYEKNE